MFNLNFNFFSKFFKINNFLTHIFVILSIQTLPLGHVRSHTKIRPDRLTRFDVYWIQSDKQTS